MSQKSKIDLLLSDEDRPLYDELERRPNVQVDDKLEWLLERGYIVSRASVGRRSKSFQEQMKKLREAKELSSAIMQTAREGDGVTDLAEANNTQLQLRIQRLLFGDDEIPAGELLNIAMSLRGSVGTKKELDEIKRKAQEALKALQSKVERKDGGVITAEDIATARKAIFGI